MQLSGFEKYTIASWRLLGSRSMNEIYRKQVGESSKLLPYFDRLTSRSWYSTIHRHALAKQVCSSQIGVESARPTAHLRHLVRDDSDLLFGRTALAYNLL